MAVTTSAVSPEQSQSWRAVIAASIGNALEWFDFVVYGFFAGTIAKLFFPTGNETESLLFALATFGVTFFMRPLGAVVLGSFADRHGRKATFSLTILIMMAGTAIIAFAPTYSSIGVFAPMLIVISGGAEPGTARLLRELAICKPGSDDHPCDRHRCDAGQLADHGTD